jgi:hypothetical protein
MQSSSEPTFKLDDLNAIDAALEPTLNELGIRNWKAGHGPQCTPCFCCCCSASVEMKTEDSQ